MNRMGTLGVMHSFRKQVLRCVTQPDGTPVVYYDFETSAEEAAREQREAVDTRAALVAENETRAAMWGMTP